MLKENFQKTTDNVVKQTFITDCKGHVNDREPRTVVKKPAQKYTEHDVPHTAYIAINKVTKMLRASLNLANHKVFNSGYAGVHF